MNDSPAMTGASMRGAIGTALDESTTVPKISNATLFAQMPSSGGTTMLATGQGVMGSLKSWALLTRSCDGAYAGPMGVLQSSMIAGDSDTHVRTTSTALGATRAAEHIAPWV
jgi:hypothetical protein